MAQAVTALTSIQADFVDKVIQTVTCEDVGELSGYPGYYRLRQVPQVQIAIATRLRALLQTDIAPAAIGLLYRFMRDDQLDPRLRVACAKSLKDTAGFVPPKARDDNGLEGKDFSTMSAEDLREASQRILKELSERAPVVIDHAPTPCAQRTQVTDVLD